MLPNANQNSSLVNNLVNLNQGADPNAVNVVMQPIRITADEWAAKARDKTECYNMIAHEYGAYLRHIDCVTMWYLRDLAAGKKKTIKGTEIKRMYIPQYD